MGFFFGSDRMTCMNTNQKYAMLRSTLLEARLKEDLTQKELAKKLNKHQSFVSKYENGERNIDVIELIEICCFLNISPLDIIEKIK